MIDYSSRRRCIIHDSTALMRSQNLLVAGRMNRPIIKTFRSCNVFLSASTVLLPKICHATTIPMNGVSEACQHMLQKYGLIKERASTGTATDHLTAASPDTNGALRRPLARSSARSARSCMCTVVSTTMAMDMSHTQALPVSGSCSVPAATMAASDAKSV